MELIVGDSIALRPSSDWIRNMKITLSGRLDETEEYRETLFVVGLENAISSSLLTSDFRANIRVSL